MAEVNGSVDESIKTEKDTKTEVDDIKMEVDAKSAVAKQENNVNGAGVGSEDDVSKKENLTETKPKLDPETLAKKIKRQIEYYFGDYNLPTDKFLKEQVKENDGWVNLETMLKFKRLASLTQDPADIVSALATSELVQVNDDKTAIRRNPDKPLPVDSEARRKEIVTRSVFVKGFPLENFTVDNALDFFENYGPPADVVLRYYNDKATKTWNFKGSCFVKYPTKEDAAAFLAIEEVKYEDTVLTKMWQEEYFELKRKERLDAKLLKRKRPVEDDKESVKEEPEETGLPKNATLHMTKCPKDLTRELIKEKMEALGVTVAFIDFNRGDDQGYIRLHGANTAETIIKECENGLMKLKEDIEVEVRALEGDEEVEFLDKAQGSINARRAKGGKSQRARRGFGRGGRGNRGGGRGHWKNRRGNNSDEPPSKAIKTKESDEDGD